MKIKFLGQNCFCSLIIKNILSDPFIIFRKSKQDLIFQRKKIDYVLITHAHGDHIADVREVLQHHPDATVIGQPEICGYFNHPNSIDINYGGSAKFDDLKISMVPAHHTSSFQMELMAVNLADICLDSKVKTYILQEIQV